MPLHVYAEFAETREHDGVQGGGRHVTAPMAQAQTFAYEIPSTGRPGPAAIHDGQVLVQAHGNPPAEIGKDARRRWDWVRQPKFSPRKFTGFTPRPQPSAGTPGNSAFRPMRNMPASRHMFYWAAIMLLTEEGVK